MVEQAASDYAKIFRSVNPEHEINPICANIEDMLARLDEFETLLVNVKSETTGIMENHVEGITGMSSDLDALQERIDHLEKFVDIVNANVDEMERVVDIAEQELHVTDYSLKGLLLKPLFSRSKANANQDVENNKTTNLRDGEFQGIPIFKTNEYFSNDEALVSSSTSATSNAATPMRSDNGDAPS